MIFREFNGDKLSSLGLGCMRLPLVGDKDSAIDESKVEEMIDFAMSNGLNYFDTAYRYHGGASETIIGKLLSKYPRESFYLATKFPGFDTDFFRRNEEIFQDQLKKCCVTYFDYYLFHNVCEKNIDAYLNDDYNVYSNILSRKKEGKIRHLGFSTHGSLETIRRFLDRYGKDLEFCQIQLNYLDWDLQNAKAKVDLIRSYGLAVWVMEPVRGGSLVNLDAGDLDKLNALRPDSTAAQWAFRFLQGIDGIGVVLSGMSNMEQLRENVNTFSEHKPLTAEENATVLSIAESIINKRQIPCTACSYCVERCPKEIQIPHIIKQYNENESPSVPGPDDCVGCRSCESVCPQGIMISEVMEKFRSKIHGK